MAGAVKLAFSTLACPAWSLDQVVEAAAAYGYEGVELRLVDGELIDGAMPASERERVRDVFKGARLPIVAVDSSVRVAVDDDAAAVLHGFIELAAAWESRIVRVFGGEWEGLRSREQAVAQARSVFAECAPYAAANGVTITLETHDRFSSTALVAEVLEGLSSAVAALWDTGHPHRLGDPPERVVELLDGRIAHVHVKDCRRVDRSDEWQLTLLGDGEVPVRDCIDALNAVGYRGWLSVEWEKKWHPELAEPEVALPQFAKMLRSWM
jgi:sugar phosphate isomerase/epimerase